MAEKHIADREASWIAVNTTPDFCKVGKKIIPFDIVRTLERDNTPLTDQFGRPTSMWRSIICGGESGDLLGRGQLCKFTPHRFAAFRITMVVHLTQEEVDHD